MVPIEPHQPGPGYARARVRWQMGIVCVAVAILAALVISVPVASAALYTVTDLGAAEKEPFEGVAVSLSASGNQVATPCALWNDGALSTYPQGLCSGTGPFNAVNTSGVLVGPENSVVEAFSISFAEPKFDFFLKSPLANEYPSIVNPVDSAYSIDDEGEIGGFVSSNPEHGARKDFGFIFDPAEPTGKQIRLTEESLAVIGLWPGWAEIEKGFDIYGYTLAVLNRSSGVIAQTNLYAGPQTATSAPGKSIASDGTLAGNIITPGGTPSVSPTLRYSNGSELPLEIGGFWIGDAQDVNESHYAVGNVQLEGHLPEAALWTPSGHLELLSQLIPSGSGWGARKRDRDRQRRCDRRHGEAQRRHTQLPADRWQLASHEHERRLRPVVRARRDADLVHLHRRR
jgi:hypothetical protein